jgi:hypothetical protein
MPLPPRLYKGDAELGKKDDDHRPGTKSQLEILWQQRRIPQPRSMRRIVLGALALIGLYYFFYNMPTDLENPRQRPHYDHSSAGFTPDSQATSTKSGEVQTGESQHYFNGPIKFYELATTLRSVSKTKGSELVNRNVLFAAASLKSAAILLPIACEMALKDRNFVHFALMGRDDIPLEVLKSVNGVTKDCMIIFHGLFCLTWNALPPLTYYRCTTRFICPKFGFSYDC